MLFKISLNNIRRRLRDYAIYFFTLVLGVAIFYVFNAISGQAALFAIESSMLEVLGILDLAMSSVSILVAVILAFLMLYANRFVMKRRHREFAIYLLLGMSKRKVSFILFLELIWIGLLSLGVGLLLGIALSQIMSALVAALFEADMTSYTFMVSPQAAALTLLYFSVIFLLIMVFNGFQLRRLQLVDLLDTGRKSEEIRLKNPLLSFSLLLAGVLGLFYAYREVSTWRIRFLSQKKLALCIALGALSTYLIFWSASAIFHSLAKHSKKLRYRGLTIFTFRQLSSRINTMVFSMTIVCLMLFVTICTLSSAFSIRNWLNNNLKKICPADFSLAYSEYSDYESWSPQDLVKILEKNSYDLTAELDRYVHYQKYTDPDFTLRDFLALSEAEASEADRPYEYLLERSERIVKLSDYNQLMSLFGREPLTLESHQYALLCNEPKIKVLRDQALLKGGSIHLMGQDLVSRYDHCLEGTLELEAQPLNEGVYIVSDTVVDERYAVSDCLTGNYKVQGRQEKAAIDEEIREKTERILLAEATKRGNGLQLRLDTRSEIYASSVGFSAISTFIGLYIGLIFLIACGAVLALKELSESVDSIGRYEILRKIGADEKDLMASLRQQLGLFFLFPLLLAALHSVFGMKFARMFLQLFDRESWLSSFGITAAIIVCIYGGYFLISYRSSRRIIQGHR